MQKKEPGIRSQESEDISPEAQRWAARWLARLSRYPGDSVPDPDRLQSLQRLALAVARGRTQTEPAG